jgi:hypothetical protein
MGARRGDERGAREGEAHLPRASLPALLPLPILIAVCLPSLPVTRRSPLPSRFTVAVAVRLSHYLLPFQTDAHDAHEVCVMTRRVTSSASARSSTTGAASAVWSTAMSRRRNVLLSYDAPMKLAYFGLARILQMLQMSLTAGASARHGVRYLGHLVPAPAQAPRGSRRPVRSVRGRDRALKLCASRRLCVGCRRLGDENPSLLCSHPAPRVSRLAAVQPGRRDKPRAISGWMRLPAGRSLPSAGPLRLLTKMAEEQMTIEPVLSESESLTWRESCARYPRYPDEWVALVEIDWIDDDEFRSARVAGHGKTRREPLDQARPLWACYDEIGHFFTGPIRAPLRAYIMP